MSDKICIVGHKGYLGSYLYHNLILSGCDVEKFTINSRLIKYDYVINCAGFVDLLGCELNPLKSRTDNMLLQKQLLGYYPEAKHIYFSSYYLYKNPGWLSRETDRVDLTAVYMSDKFLAEQDTLKNHNNIVFRLGKLFGHPNINKKIGLLEAVIKNKEMKVDGVLFNPTSLNQVFRVILFELNKKRLSGLYNLANSGVLSHFDFVNTFNSLLTNEYKCDIIFSNEKMHGFPNYGNFAMDTRKLNYIVDLVNWKVDLLKYADHVNDTLKYKR